MLVRLSEAGVAPGELLVAAEGPFFGDPTPCAAAPRLAFGDIVRLPHKTRELGAGDRPLCAIEAALERDRVTHLVVLPVLLIRWRSHEEFARRHQYKRNL